MFQASVFSLCLLSDNYHIYIFMSNKHKKFCIKKTAILSLTLLVPQKIKETWPLISQELI